MTDAQECRANAFQCINMANNGVDNLRAQRALFEMAKTWLKLAEKYESADTFAVPACSAKSS